MTQHFGKHRGKVANNVDLLSQGRLQVTVPSVLGDGRLSWAMPCVPFAGNGVGHFMLPPVGANVWVEFEAGDPDYPIWTGCFWGPGECPATPALAGLKVIKTGVAMITIDDLTQQGVIIETTSGAKLSLTASGVELTNGPATISLSGPTVSINNGALDVT